MKAANTPKKLGIHVMREWRLPAGIALEKQRTMNFKGRCMNIDSVFTRRLMRFAREFLVNVFEKRKTCEIFRPRSSLLARQT